MVYSHMPIAYAIYRDRDGRATWGRLVKLFRVVTSEATVRLRHTEDKNVGRTEYSIGNITYRSLNSVTSQQRDAQTRYMHC